MTGLMTATVMLGWLRYPAAVATNGLRARLLGQVDPSLLTRLAGWAGFLSRAEVDDSVIRTIASPRQQKLNQGSVYTDYGGQIDKTLWTWCVKPFQWPYHCSRWP